MPYRRSVWGASTKPGTWTSCVPLKRSAGARIVRSTRGMVSARRPTTYQGRYQGVTRRKDASRMPAAHQGSRSVRVLRAIHTVTRTKMTTLIVRLVIEATVAADPRCTNRARPSTHTWSLPPNPDEDSLAMLDVPANDRQPAQYGAKLTATTAAAAPAATSHCRGRRSPLRQRTKQ